MRNIKTILVILIGFCNSCDNYLDVVPDNVATIDMAFKMRVTAEQYLFTCYSYLPSDAHVALNPAIYGADELWHYADVYPGVQIAKGSQGKGKPIMDYWSGSSASMSAPQTGSIEGTFTTSSLWQAIRDCNIFLENIHKVKDMDQFEKNRWIGEVKFLKAYYHFYLLRMYGPIPLMKENLPITAGGEEVLISRNTVDECVDYIVQLLDEAAADEKLPLKIEDRTTELGRITLPAVLALKAKVLVTAASPLFNGNTDYSDFANIDGKKLFNLTNDSQKWEKATLACKEAIDVCHLAGHKLYTYSLNINASNVGPETFTKMSIRGSVTSRENPEVIWANTRSSTSALQREAQARLDGETINASSVGRGMAPTLKIAEAYYTKNGVPIEEDKTWDYESRYDLRLSTIDDRFYITPNYYTVSLHFDREPRFYGSLAFDGSVWYGQGRLSEEEPWHVEAKLGQYAGGPPGGNRYSITGYFPKKMVNPLNTYSATSAYVIVEYNWPIIRLADLYLLYAESLNELNGPQEDVFEYLNLVRARAGLKSVQESWEQFSKNPTKYQTKNGLRDIIHRERTIELAFEGHRFWDIRRWKTAINELNNPVYGWDVGQSDAEYYYRPRLIFNQTFRLREYFWPIREYDIIVNKNLVQNPGW